MEDSFNLVPEEVKLAGASPANFIEYEYAESKFSPVFVSLMKENTKLLPTMEETDPRREKVNQLLSYFDHIKTEGWNLYEIVRETDENGMMNPFEIRRFRRLRK